MLPSYDDRANHEMQTSDENATAPIGAKIAQAIDKIRWQQISSADRQISQIAGYLAPRLPAFCLFFINDQIAITIDCD